MEGRIKWFSGNLPPHALELDEDGIPAVAYWNTENDTPVRARKLPGAFVIEVEYQRDPLKDTDTPKQSEAA